MHSEVNWVKFYFLITAFNCISSAAAAVAKSLQSCPTLCNPIEGSPPGSSVTGISPGKNPGGGCHCLL